MARPWLVAAGACGALAVLLGAFGAHALRDWLQGMPDGATRLEWWRTAAHYHLVHALALGLSGADGAGGVAARESASGSGGSRGRAARAARVAPWAFVCGLTLFSGSLYLMTLTNMRWLGAITPLGGVALVVGWLSLALSAAGPGAGPGPGREA